MEKMVIGLEHGGKLRQVTNGSRWPNYHVFRHLWELRSPRDVWQMATEAMALGASYAQVEPYFALCEVDPAYPWDYAQASQTYLSRVRGGAGWCAVWRGVGGQSAAGQGKTALAAIAALKRSMLDNEGLTQ